ncbi:MAG: hypothetical protein QM706_16050 [Nitrospira sp.]
MQKHLLIRAQQGPMIGGSLFETREGCLLEETLRTRIVDELLIAYQAFFHENLAPRAEAVADRGHL